MNKEELRQQYFQSIEPLLQSINARGYDLTDIEQLKVEEFIPLPRDITQEVLSFLDTQYGNIPLRVTNALVRILGLAGTIEDTSVLRRIFEESNQESFKQGKDYSSISWAIANTFSLIQSPDASEWLIDTINQSKYGKSREMLTYAIANNCAPQVARNTLMDVFDELPGHSAEALSICGDDSTVNFLKQKLNSEIVEQSPNWVKKEVEKSIKNLTKKKKD